MINTVIGIPIREELLREYFSSLVNRFFKILPIWENGEKSLPIYIRSLQAELIGCKGFIPELENNAGFLTLTSILQYLLDNPDCPIKEVRREIFGAISICNRLKARYTEVL